MADEKLKQFALKLKDELQTVSARVSQVEKIRAVARDGRDGAHGTPGEPGAKGDRGEVGEVGPRGQPGRDGRDGQTGFKGDSVTKVAVEPGNLLAVWIGGIKTLAGSITTQRGEEGERGAQGPTGPQGPAGKDGKDGENGTSVTKVELNGRDLFVWLDGVKKRAGQISFPSLGAPGAAGGGGIKGPHFNYRALKVIKSTKELTGTLRSDVLYVIDGQLDFSGTGRQIEVPAGGLNIEGHSVGVSALVCTDDDYTMFKSPPGGSGTFIGKSLAVSVTGSNSKVYDLQAATPGVDFLTTEISYKGCTSRGELNGYGQGLEEKVELDGGTPGLTLSGTWPRGYRAEAFAVLNLDDAMNAPLFKAGAGLSLGDRFITDINADLGDTASISDFSAANFTRRSAFQIINAFVSRNGISNSEDATLLPNITASDVVSFWRNNVGVGNTFLGGRAVIDAQAETTINSIGVFEDIAGTYATNALEHFDSPADGELRHLGDDPRDFQVALAYDITGTAGDTIRVKLVKWDDSAGMFVDIGQKTRNIIGGTGPNDLALFDFLELLTLDRNDYVKAQVANLSSTNNVTALNDSSLFVSER